MEHSGDERFLSVAPLDITQLSQMNLVHLGDTVAGMPGHAHITSELKNYDLPLSSNTRETIKIGIRFLLNRINMSLTVTASTLSAGHTGNEYITPCCNRF